MIFLYLFRSAKHQLVVSFKGVCFIKQVIVSDRYFEFDMSLKFKQEKKTGFHSLKMICFNETNTYSLDMHNRNNRK
jgi:hypothetical protein